jgi:hypothetical protein
MNATFPVCDYIQVLCLEAKYEFRRISVKQVCRILDKLTLK